MFAIPSRCHLQLRAHNIHHVSYNTCDITTFVFNTLWYPKWLEIFTECGKVFTLQSFSKKGKFHENYTMVERQFSITKPLNNMVSLFTMIMVTVNMVKIMEKYDLYRKLIAFLAECFLTWYLPRHARVNLPISRPCQFHQWVQQLLSTHNTLNIRVSSSSLW